MSSILIRNARHIYLTEDNPEGKRLEGSKMSEIPSLFDGWILVEDEKILDFGPMHTCPESADEILDLQDQFIIPAWCDSHTHLVYQGSREQEFVDRIRGLSYEEIAARGGGILNSAGRLQEASEESLYEQAVGRLQEIIKYGTGAVEIKSGYGLTTEAEIKMLRVARRLKENFPVTIKTTFLGAHAFPLEYKKDREGYINLLLNEMLPLIADQGLADYIDVFCEKGFFTVDETDKILSAGAKYGLKAKVHANQLYNSGGVQVGVKNNAISVDHLETISDTEIEVLKGSPTIATLLPSASFFLGMHYAPARKMIDSGLGVALATDYNPGSTPSGKIPFVLSLACLKMGMLPEEAMVAATINGAYAMEIADTHGSIARGKMANFIITKRIPSLAFVPYSFGSDLIDRVIIKGKIM